MTQKVYVLLSIIASLALFLSACGEAQPTPDVAAISTAAVQTVEARFTQQASQQPTTTSTPLPPVGVTATATLGFPPTLTTAPGQPTATSSGRPCYAAAFLADVTIPDGMIIAPGTNFKKTWRIRNDGNCVWDQSYAMTLSQGDAMGTVTRFPLSKVVYPGESIDISVDLTAPTVENTYTGYWRIATPFGGTFGVGTYDQAMRVLIKVSPKPDRDFGVASVVISDWNRKPVKGCNADGAVYTFTATVTANGPGDIDYRWDTNPPTGEYHGGKLKFTEAGSKSVYLTWSLHPDSVQDVDRWVALTILLMGKEQQFDRFLFHFTCKQ